MRSPRTMRLLREEVLGAREQPPPATTRENLCAAMKTQHSKKNFFKERECLMRPPRTAKSPKCPSNWLRIEMKPNPGP